MACFWREIWESQSYSHSLWQQLRIGSVKRKKKEKEWRYLVKSGGRGNVPGAECSTSGQDTEAKGLLFTKTGLDYEQWQEAKTSITTQQPHLSQFQFNWSYQSVNAPTFCNKPTNVCSQVDRRSLRACPALPKLMTVKRYHCTMGTSNYLPTFQEIRQLPISNSTLPPPQAIIRGETWPFPSLLW